MRHYLTIDQTPTTDFGVYISGSGTFDAPERDAENFSIPGKNGDVIIDNGRYHNITVTYPAFIYRDLSVNVEGLRNLLLSHSSTYARIEDTYHPTEFRLGRYTGGFEAEVEEDLRGAHFSLTFDCKPQRFLKNGETPIDMQASGAVFNPTIQNAKPLLRVFGVGSFIIGDYTMTISSADGYTDIDCDIQDCFKGTTNCNGNVSGSFPVLVPGRNLITLNSGITRLIIWPRWWIV